jgi:hypothetical protein
VTEELKFVVPHEAFVIDIAFPLDHPTISVVEAILHRNFSGREATKNLAPASRDGSNFLLLVGCPVMLLTFSQSLSAIMFLS